MREAIAVDGGESPLSAQIIISAIGKKKRREKVLYLLRKERAYRTLWSNSLVMQHEGKPIEERWRAWGRLSTGSGHPCLLRIPT